MIFLLGSSLSYISVSQEYETQDKMKEFNVSAKLSALSKEMDTLLSATEAQMEIVRKNQF